MIERSEYSHDEHRARAALMGLTYDWRDSTYNDMSEGADDNVWIWDADTLDPLTPTEAQERRVKWGTFHDLLPGRAMKNTPKNLKETPT